MWKNYGVQVQGTPDDREVNHSAFVYGVTGTGAVRRALPVELPAQWIAHDAPLLASA